MKKSLLLIALLVSGLTETLGQIPRANQQPLINQKFRPQSELDISRQQKAAVAAQRQQAAIAAQHAAQIAATKNAEWAAFWNDAVANLANEKSNAVAKLSANTVWNTNFVKAGPNHRLVNGETYDVAHSKLWGSPLNLTGGLAMIANDGHPIRYEVIADRIGTDKVVCHLDAITYWFEKWTGAPQDEFRQTIKTIVIYNYPAPEKLVTGASFTCNCMRVENYIQNGISLEAYDCGIKATNLVREVVAQNQSDFDKIDLEYEAKIKNLPNEYAKQLKDKEDETERATIAKTVAWNQAQADKGDSFGLLRMGERYRDGDGVDKDLAKARAYLTRAAAAGSPTAEAELNALPKESD